MDVFKIIWDAFSFEKMSLKQLLTISSYIDDEKHSPGSFSDSTEDEASIACVVIAMQCQPSMCLIGERLYNSINDLIVKKNTSSMDPDKSSEEYKKLQEKVSSGTFKIRQMRNGYRFDLVASNGEFLACSEIYSTLDSCYNGITSAKKHANAPVEDQSVADYEKKKNPKYEMYTDKTGEYRFRLRASNGLIIMVSEGYKSATACLGAIEKMMKASVTTDIEKV